MNRIRSCFCNYEVKSLSNGFKTIHYAAAGIPQCALRSQPFAFALRLNLRSGSYQPFPLIGVGIFLKVIDETFGQIFGFFIPLFGA